MKRFITVIMEKISNGVQKFESIVEMLAFYIGFGIIGSEEQMITYSYHMLEIKDEMVQKKILSANHQIFQPDWLHDLYNTRMNLGIYGDHERQKYRKDLLVGKQEMHQNDMVEQET